MVGEGRIGWASECLRTRRSTAGIASGLAPDRCRIICHWGGGQNLYSVTLVFVTVVRKGEYLPCTEKSIMVREVEVRERSRVRVADGAWLKVELKM